MYVCVCFEFYVPLITKVIWSRDFGLKAHQKVWRSLESSLQPLAYEASSLTTTQWRLLSDTNTTSTSDFTWLSYLPMGAERDLVMAIIPVVFTESS